jgi:acid phosphatase type 7
MLHFIQWVYFTQRFLYLNFSLLLIIPYGCWSELSEETIYLTWQRDPSTTMTIQWLSDLQEEETMLVYRLKNQPITENKLIKGEYFPLPQTSNYLIHRIELIGLQPNTDYIFQICPDQKEYLFHTAPSDLVNELRFVVGGDMYHDTIQLVAQTCQKAAQTSPAFALLGGDIAYAVGLVDSLSQNVERWVEWVKIWHTYMVTPQGYLIPVIAAIGNHDLIGQFDQTRSQAAIFSTLFPMPGAQVYNSLDFGSYLTLFILDSGHANSIGGAQTQWLQRALQERSHVLHRFAIYHVPAYPSVREFGNRHSAAIRQYWVPLFEQGGIQTAFEHHDHAYKRTYPLLRNQINPKGVVYLGDGAWGVAVPRQAQQPNKTWMAKVLSERHFIAVTLTSTQQSFKSINDAGKVIDEYVRPLAIEKVSHPPTVIHPSHVQREECKIP